MNEGKARIAPDGEDLQVPELLYRVMSFTGGLGYGFPQESVDAALAGFRTATVAHQEK